MKIQVETEPFSDNVFNTFIPQIAAECEKWVDEQISYYDALSNDNGIAVINIKPAFIAITYRGDKIGSELVVEKINIKFATDEVWDNILLRIIGPSLS